MSLILGYACHNDSLEDKGIHFKTTRQETIVNKEKEKKGSGWLYVMELLRSNLEAIKQMMLFNIKYGIKLYRMPSDICPHLTNPRFLKAGAKYDELAYDISETRSLWREIGDMAIENDIRLTFHPDIFVVLNTPNENILIKTFRDLYAHSLWISYLYENVPEDKAPVIVMHGGGVYGDKDASIKRWITNFRRLPQSIRKYIVIENDEKSYSIEDVIGIAQITKIPVVYDIFHHFCYIGQKPISAIEFNEIFTEVLKTWPNKNPKMHISEQRKDARMGTHSDYVRTIPKFLINAPKKFGINLYLMVEAKAKEKAVLYLKKKYDLQ